MNDEEQKQPKTDEEEQTETHEIEDDSYEDDDDDQPIVLPKIKQFLAWFWSNRKRTIPIALMSILIIIFVVPAPRYAVLGLVVKRNMPVIVKDSTNGLPVSDAKLSFKGKTIVTDGEGRAVFSDVAVGYGEILIEKPYYDYKQQRIALGLGGPSGDYQLSISANGRQVPVQTTNKITGERLAGVRISAGDVTATTDKNGEAILVLPPSQNQAEVSIEHNGFNFLQSKVVVSQEVVDENTLALVPAGKVYFLSRRSGQINLMKANLDGSEAKVVIKATGQENPNDTVLLASRDWNYLALKARRNGKSARLYLVDTKTEDITEIDGADEAIINPIGWSGNHFVYTVERTNVDFWKAKKTALKSFEASNQTISVIDQNNSEGSNQYDADYQQFSNIVVAQNRVVYGKHWIVNSYNSQVKNKKTILYDSELGKADPKILREFVLKQDEYGYYNNHLSLNQAMPGEVLVRYFNGSDKYLRYKSGEIVEPQVKSGEFQKSYPSFLDSPGNQNTFWHDERDGKNTLFVGDSKGGSGQVIATSSPYKPFGWFTDRYVLVSKEDSELYIMPSNGTGGLGEIVKITDYHKPASYFGHGYGGL